MKKLVFAFGLGAALFSCTAAEDKLCDCIEVGNELNTKTHQLLQSTPTEKLITEVKALRKKKKKACKDFEEMSGRELMKRKETCEKN